MKPAYYNDNDAYCAQWLRNLIAAGHLPAGEVDERPIQDVRGVDLGRFGQCHFFAGIGGWPLALRLAGWPDDRDVWTGSPPCQPFSAAGKRKGVADERHLWPEFARLIAERRPARVFGEQVASKDGRLWLAGVRTDLEALGYAVGAGDLCAAGAGEEGEGWILRGNKVSVEQIVISSPHVRQRLYWMADANDRREGLEPRSRRAMGERRESRDASSGPGRSGATGGMAESAREQVGRAGQPRELSDGRMADTETRGLRIDRSASRDAGYADERGEIGRLVGVDQPGSQGQGLRPDDNAGQFAAWSSGFDVIDCADGKARRVESGTFPLAHGIPNRMGRLRGYGNAIVPQVAAEFIAAVMECRP